MLGQDGAQDHAQARGRNPIPPMRLRLSYSPPRHTPGNHPAGSPDGMVAGGVAELVASPVTELVAGCDLCLHRPPVLIVAWMVVAWPDEPRATQSAAARHIP